MRLQTARRGRNAGGKFWSCKRFPKCRGTRNVIIDDSLRPSLRYTRHQRDAPTPFVADTDQTNTDSPRCPKCGTLMALKTAKYGRNAGRQFWSCPNYPTCDGAINVTSEERPTSQCVGMTIPIDWTEPVQRTEFNCEYVSIGSVPGVIRNQVGDNETLKRLFSHTLLLWTKDRERGGATEHARLTSALLAKLLQRGHTPLPTLGIEYAALKRHKLIDKVVNLAERKVEVGWQLLSELKTTDCYSELVEELITKERFTLADDARHSLLQTDDEVEFLTKWVPSNLGEAAGHWFTPQAPLDTLLESAMLDEGAARRIDFLVYYPDGEPLAIEIDGPEHLSAHEIDRARDKALRSIGIDVVRVSNQEVRDGEGPQLNKIKNRFEEWQNRLQPARPNNNIRRLAADCSIASKIQFAITRAISFGWLSGDAWEIDLRGVNCVGRSGVLDALRLLYCFDILYGQRSVPKLCTVRVFRGSSVTWKLVDGRWKEEQGKEAAGARITIVVEQKSSPFHTVEYDDTPDCIIRPAFLPVQLAVEQPFVFTRRSISPSSYENVRPALREFLRNIFRKYDFRHRQGEAVLNSLCQNDSVVLLPTGAGKSIIYQLAGLLMPGITIIVDPIIALIEDQVEGLQEYGIDRAVGIVSNINGQRDLDRLLRQIERGEYQFVLHSPERLQSPQFRSTLQALREMSLINLAVIDEAHCVSEWGHDFRPAYLNLANNLRRLGADLENRPPPLLALTGTASRAVLHDVLTDLGIDRSDSRALIRPESFDRKELKFEVKRATVTPDAQAFLRGILYAMPGKFGMVRAQFYAPNKRDTASGVIFTRTVNSRYTGLIDTMEAVQTATGAKVTTYSGQPPRSFDGTNWERQKRSNANAFKHNKVPVLVATKAFGMGIDKPNIRYIVHFGMPGSLESFYQEAGRAGRDQKRAHCVTVFTEYDANRSDGLIDPSADLSELRRRFAVADKNPSIRDDVTSAMWFHLETFAGSEQDVEDIEDILNRIDLGSRNELTWSDDKDKRRKEHAIIRLLKLGVIRDYQIEFGSHKLIVDSEPLEFGRCRAKLLEYIQTAQPARSKIFAELLKAIRPSSPSKNALNLARLLIEFTYDVIERSRRRMIQESVLLARSSRNDAEIRMRLLDYLQEGLGSEQINRLLEQQEVQLEEWWKLIEAVQNPLDAGELRGLCARSLESFPDHPGLLLTRAVAETMCSDHNDSASWQGISTAIRSCAKYRVPENDIQRIVHKLYDLSQVTARAGELGMPLTMALLDIDATGSAFGYCATIASQRATELTDQQSIEMIFSVYELKGTVQIADAATKSIIERYGHPEISRLLRGYFK